MATYYSGWVATDDWRIRMDCASASPANSTTGTVYVHCAIESQYGVARYGAQIVITVDGQSQTVRTGAISTGATSWADQVSFTVRRGHGAIVASISARATCPESGVSAYQSGTSVSGSETLAAVTSHTTTYDGNGGTVNGAARQTQTKWYGALEYVPTYTMARDGCGFLGWGTASDSTTASYVAGQAYGLDIDQTLYAVWKRLYIAPTISGLSVVRATSDGTEDNEGTYAAISLSWAVDTTLDESNVVSSVTVAWKEHGSDADFGDEAALAVTGTTSGTASGTVGAGAFDTAKSYQVRVTVSDSGGSSQSTTILSPSFFTLDLSAGGKGVGVLCQAPAEGVKVSGSLVHPVPSALGTSGISDFTLASATSGLYIVPVECPGGVFVTGNSTGSTLAADAAFCTITCSERVVMPTNAMFIRGVFHGYQPGVRVTHSGQTLLLTPEWQFTLNSPGTFSMFIPLIYKGPFDS